MDPRVSVIIPCYNQGRFLPFSLQSVLEQTFQDWEAVIVNDGSIDNTAAVAAQFRDPRILYIEQKNRGLAGARNKGIHSARAQIIALLDSDDLWEPEFLEIMMDQLERYPQAAGAYCGHQYVDVKGQEIGVPSLKVVPPETFHHHVSRGNWLVPGAVVFRKAIAQEMGLFDESMRAVEDTDLWIRMSARYEFVGVPEILVKYRRHGSNMTADPQHMVKALYQLTQKMHGPLDENDVSGCKEKRIGYAMFYESAARKYLEVGNYKKSADYFEKMVNMLPSLPYEMWVWRSVSHAHLPIEVQADRGSFNWTLAQRDVLGLLCELHTRSKDASILKKSYPKMKASAFVALAQDSVDTGRFWLAYRWLGLAALTYPGVLFARRFWGTVARGIWRSVQRARNQLWN
jgi:glycosyltransferase involved in cell wall biosynthesis